MTDGPVTGTVEAFEFAEVRPMVLLRGPATGQVTWHGTLRGPVTGTWSCNRYRRMLCRPVAGFSTLQGLLRGPVTGSGRCHGRYVVL